MEQRNTVSYICLLLGSLPSGPNCTNLQCECFQMPKQYIFFPDLCVKILDALLVVVTLLLSSVGVCIR